MDFDKTMSFNFEKEKNAMAKETLKEVYEANSRLYFIRRSNIYNEP